MKAKLIKSDIQYRLHNEEGIVIATSLENGKLSIKNCEAIANGYDLYELVAKRINDFNIIDKAIEFSNANSENNGAYLAYIAGAIEMAKALEILGDKKFSELDMRIAYDAGCNNIDADDNIDFQDTINSLQQTEWDVEIVMDKDCYSSAGRCDKLIMADCIICTPVTYLRDENGCLILKRV